MFENIDKTIQQVKNKNKDLTASVEIYVGQDGECWATIQVENERNFVRMVAETDFCPTVFGAMVELDKICEEKLKNGQA